MDLVKIGFLIQTSGLEKANKEVDSLLDKTGKIGAVSKKSATEVESSQNKAKKATEETTKAVEKNTKAVEKGNKEADKAKKAAERTTQALEKQKIVGEYLAKGLDKSTATSLANFRQLKASVIDTNTMFTLLGNNSTLDKTNKQARAVNDSLNKMKLNLDLVGKGFSASEQAQLRQLKLNGATNAQLEEAIELIKKRKQAEVLADYQNNKASLSREWMSAYDKEIESRIAKEKEAAAKIQQVRDTVSDYEARSKRSFGGGILDQVEAENKEILALRKKYTDEINAIADKEASDSEIRRMKEMEARQNEYQKAQADAEKARQERFSAEQKQYQKDMDALKKSQDEQEAIRQRAMKQRQDEYQANMALLDKEREKVKQANAERERDLLIEEKRSQYVAQGYGKGDAKKLATLDVAGVDPDYLERYKKSLAATTTALGSFGDAATKASASHSGLTSQIRGIAFYAVLSTAIYGVMTAMMGLTSATVRMADEYIAIQNRMKLYITDAEELADVNQKLTEYAMANNVGLRETATLFTRLAPSMQRLGKDTEAITTVVDAFGKSMRIGGATAMEAASATIQFSQAMASGKLAGDEFRSISEASPRFLKAIADGSGIAASKLKEMSSAGLLTTEVISNALIKEYGKLSEENLKLGVTLEQGSNAIVTAFTRFIGEFNEGAGVTKFFGESLMDVALSLSDLANTAKESGASMNQWLTDNKKNIELLGNTALLVASIFAGKLVASLVATTLSAVSAKVSVMALNVSIATMGTTARGSALAMTALSTAVKGLFRLMGGWVGIAATLATAYLGFKSLEKGASEATQELVSQSKYISMTTDELKALGVVQKDLAKFKLNLDMAEAEKNVKAAKDNVVKAFDEIIYKWHFISKSGDAGFVKQYDEIVASVKDGSIPFDLAVKKLVEMDAVTEDVAKELYKMTGEYDKTVDSALPFVKVLKDLGVEHKITKDATLNGRTENELYKKSLGDIADQARDTENALGGLAAKYKAAADVIRGGMQVALITGIKDKQLSEELYKDADERAKTLKSTAVMRNPSGVTAEQLIKSGLFKDELAQQKELYKLQKQSSDFYKESAESKKSDVNNYPEQLEQLNRFLSILKTTSDVELARIASTKEYHKWYKGNLDVARQIVALEKQRSEIEKEIQDALDQETARVDYEKALRKEEEVMTRITLLMAKGVDYEVARQVAQAYYTDNAKGIAAASLTYMNTLNSSLSSLESQVVVQEQVNAYMREGVDLERATFNATLDRAVALGVISEESAKAVRERQKELSITSQAQQEERKRLESASKMRKDITDLALQAMVLAMAQDSAIADIINGYEHIDSEAAKELSTRQLIIDKLKEQYDYQKSQKANPLGDFSKINFDVFGDFGNPFKSALEGLNAMIGGVALLDQQYGDMYRDLNKQWNEAAANSIERTQIEKQRATLEQGYIREKAALNDEAVSNMLSASKQFFKEESKGYKVLSAAEKAFTVFKLVQGAKRFAIEMGFITKETGAYVAGSLSKKTAELGFTAFTVVQKGIQAAASGVAALASSMAGLPFPLNIAAFAATGALLASIGLNLAGGGSAKGTFAPTNEGTGTVFGDTEAKSESIKKSIDLLADNSDLMLPLTDAMLRSLRNIESNIGGLTNLLIRTGVGKDFNIAEGFKMNAIGSGITKTFSSFNDLTFGAADFLTLGLFSAVGDLLGGLFGTKTTVKGQGLYGRSQSLESILENGFMLQEYVDVNVKKKTLGVTTSNKNKTYYSAADQQLANQFTLIFEGLYDSILNASTVLGMNVDTVADALEGTVISMGKINLKGLKGEEIQEKLMAVFGAAADQLAQAAVKGLDDFQQVGEGYYETLIRVATGIEQANYFTDRLNVTAIKYTDIINKQGDVAAEIVRQSVLLVDTTKNIKGGFYDLVNTFEGSAEELTNFIFTLRDLQDQLVMTGKDADYLTSAMILGAGGLDKLSSGFDAYFEMLSPAEQAAELTRRLTNEFDLIGQTLPSDVKAFRALVNSIDTTTEAGQKLYGQIIALAPEFNDLQDAIESANSDINELVESLRDLAEQARQARGETEQPRNLDYTRAMFESTAMLAMQGDTQAAEKLMSLGTDLMNLSKQYSVDGSEYARDLALIQRAATVSADVQEAGLGYTSTTLSTSLPSSNATPTLATTATSTDDKLDALREDLNAALLAIAKYTQSTANKLENWDDGNRMMVGVIQEAGDPKVPVTTA